MQLDDAAGLAGHFLGQPLAGHAALVDEVGGDGGEVEAVGRVHGPVEQDHGDLGVGGLLQHFVPAVGDDGGQKDGIDTLGDEAPDRLDLVFLLLLGVGELEVDPPLLGFLPGHRGLGGAPAGFGTDLAEADGQIGGHEGSGDKGNGAREERGFDVHDFLPWNVVRSWIRLSITLLFLAMGFLDEADVFGFIQIIPMLTNHSSC